MRYVLAWVVAFGLMVGAAYAQQDGARTESRGERAKAAMTDEQKKEAVDRHSKDWERMLDQTKKLTADLEAKLPGVADAAVKKEAEDALAKMRTTSAGLESAIAAAKKGDYDEAIRIGRDIQGPERETTLDVKLDIDKYTQVAAKSAGSAQAAAAAQKVVDLSKKKLDLIAQIDQARKDLNTTNSDIQAAKWTAEGKPEGKRERAARE